MKSYNGFDVTNVDSNLDIVVIVDKYPVVGRMISKTEIKTHGLERIIKLDDVKYISYLTNDFDLFDTVSAELILERAKALSLEDIDSSRKIVGINSNYINWTEYQRAAFEYFYPGDPNDLNHVNFFRPSACYYPLGWYNLGGQSSTESDLIGERVDQMWNAWRFSLMNNNRLGVLQVKSVTYEGS